MSKTYIAVHRIERRFDGKPDITEPGEPITLTDDERAELPEGAVRLPKDDFAAVAAEQAAEEAVAAEAAAAEAAEPTAAESAPAAPAAEPAVEKQPRGGRRTAAAEPAATEAAAPAAEPAATEAAPKVEETL